MNLKTLFQSLVVSAVAALGIAMPAQAAITPFFVAGNSCAGAPGSGSYSPGSPGATTQISLCVSTNAERICGSGIGIQSAVGESGRFAITARALGATFPDPNFAGAIPFPVSISSPPSGVDFGGSNNSLTPSAINTTTLLATFDIQPQTGTATATTISLAPASQLARDNDGGCGTGGTAPTIIGMSASYTLTPSSAPTSFSSANSTTFTAGVAGNFNVVANGSPTPTYQITTGALPGSVTLSAAGVLAGTAPVPGSFAVTIRAQNVNGFVDQPFTLNVAGSSQTITFPNPGGGTVAFSGTPFPSGATTDAVGLTPQLASNSTGVCTVTGLNINFVTAGSCSITATSPAAGAYSAATPVNRVFNITPVAPSAPTGVVGSAGFQSATISFNPVTGAATGGNPITGYTATCTGVPTASVTGTSSPLTVTGLTNGNVYSCVVFATNSTPSNSANSSAVSVTPVNIAAPLFTSSATVPALTVGVAMPTFNIAASGGPTPTIAPTGAGALPTGVVFTSGGNGSGTATLTGTPQVAGSFTFGISATSATAPAAQQTLVVTVAKGTRTVNFTGPANQPYTPTPIPLTATTTPAGGAVTFSTTTSTICTVANGPATVTIISVGVCSIDATSASDANYNAATTNQTFTISKANQTITFGAQTSPRGFSATPIAISPVATTTSNLPITYTGSGACTAAGTTPTFTTTGIGACTITASQAGNANYNAAAVSPTQVINIQQGSQTISFNGLPDQPLGAPPVLIGPTSSSGLAVTVTVAPGTTACSASGVNGTTITLLALGTCSLVGTQAGNANFASATATASFNVIPPGAVNLTSSANPALYRNPVILTATIQGTNPTGTVTFNLVTASGPVVICPAVPLVNAVATCPISASQNVTQSTTYSAIYSGDGANPSNVRSFVQLVNMSGVTLSAVTTPIQPIVGATVTLKATVSAASLPNKVTINENGTAVPNCGSLTVALLPGKTDVGVATCTIPAITAGLHNYVVTYPHSLDAGFEQITVPVTPLLNTASDYTDMWWVGPSENGWGVSITQHGRNQFIVLYVYDSAGNPIWYVLPEGTWNAANTAFTGALYSPTSSPYSSYLNAGAFKPTGVTGSAVGTATVTYTGAGAATLTYTINGISGSKNIIRQAFATDDGQPKMQVGDLWWAGIQQNGWGINIAQQGRVLFPVWYTYDTQGRTVFYTVPGGTWTGSTFTGDIYSTVSSVWLGVNYNPAQFVVTKIGTMSLDFSDQSNAVMTYTIGNLTQKKVIMRQPY